MKRYVLVPTLRPSVQKAAGVEIPVGVFEKRLEAGPMPHISAAFQVTLREDYGFAVELREHANAAHLPLHWGTFVRNQNAPNPIPELWQ